MTAPPASPPPLLSPAEAAACLLWQYELGADEGINETPTNWANYQPTATSRPLAALSGTTTNALPSAPALTPAPAPRLTIPQLTDLNTLTTLDQLREALLTLQGLAIKKTAMNMVFGEGPLSPPVMLVGEAPGEEEDRSGRPFVGRAGQLLEKMLASIGLSREQVYITNLLLWRPPGNRTPKSDEVAVCLPYLLRHIELVAPRTLVLLGGPAAKAILGRDDSVTRLRGEWHQHQTAGLPASVPTLVTYHPAYLLRTPVQKRESWRDLCLLTKKLGPV